MLDTFGCVHSLSLGLIGRRVRKPPEIAIFGTDSTDSTDRARTAGTAKELA